MKKVLIVGMIMGMSQMLQPAQALEVHPVGMAKSAVKVTVGLVDAAVSKVKGVLSRTITAGRMLVRTGAVTADTAAEGLAGSAQQLLGE